MNILFLILAFIVADASDQTPGKSCLGIATAESAVGGAAIGWGAGSTAEAVIARAGAVGLGAVLVHHAFQDESTKSSCKTVAAIAGASVGLKNRHQQKGSTPASPPAGGGGGGAGGGGGGAGKGGGAPK